MLTGPLFLYRVCLGRLWMTLRNVRRLPVGAMMWNPSLVAVDMRESRTQSLSQRRFTGCRNLSLVDLPPGLERVGHYASMGCDLLVIANGRAVKSLDEACFEDWRGLVAASAAVVHMRDNCFARRD